MTPNLVIVLATALLALGYGLILFPLGFFVAIFVGLGWLGAHKRGKRWASLGLVLFTLMAGLGLELSVPPLSLLFLAGGVSALAAWDLESFFRRLEYAREEDRHGLLGAHLKRLRAVGLAGFVLAGVASVVRLDLGLVGAVLLGTLVILGLSRVVGRQRMEDGE